MIAEEKKELIDKQALIKKIVQKGNQESDGAMLRFSLSAIEILELVYEMPVEDERCATWVWESNNKKWVCSNCKMTCLDNSFGAPMASRHCPYCGRRMK